MASPRGHRTTRPLLPMTTLTTVDHLLPSGIRLRCRVAGPAGAPLMLFVHGFPEAAFVWDEMLTHFAQ